MGYLRGSNKSYSLNFCLKLFLENKVATESAGKLYNPSILDSKYCKFLETSTDHLETVQQFVTRSHIFPSHVNIVLNLADAITTKSISEYVAKLSVKWLTIRSFLLGVNNCIPEDVVVLQQVV